MIRPLTIATFLLAAGSGLYLYQSKHEVQLLDRTIEHIVHDTATLREQSRLLAAEWTMLNDPERLRQFSDTYLSLRTISPAQFSSAADLDGRLPAPQAEIPPPVVPAVAEAPPPDSAPPTAPPIAAPTAPQTGVPVAETEPASAVEQPLPIPPIPTVRPVVAITAIPHPAETKPLSEAKAPFETKAIDRPVPDRPVLDRPVLDRPVLDRPTIDRTAMARPVAPDLQSRSASVTDTRPYDQRAYDPRPPEQRAPDQRPYDQRAYDPRPPEQRAPDQRPAPKLADARPDVRIPPRQVAFTRPPLPAPGPVNGPPPITPYQAQARPSAPLNGSLLGVAHGSLPPAPRPTPVNATYNSN